MQLTPLQNLWQNTTTIQKLLIITIPFIFFAIAITSIIIIIQTTSTPTSENPDAKHITIDNFSTVAPNIPKFYQQETQGNIWQILNDYNNIPYDTYTSGNIRENSYQETTTDNIHDSNFIVDIPALKHSFSISFLWYDTNTPDEYNIMVECPNYTDVIYRDTYCYTSNQPFDNLYSYLPATISSPTSQTIQLSAGSYNDNYSAFSGQPYLMVDFSSCNEDIDITPIRNLVSNWLKEHYIDENLINTQFYPYCAVQTELY